MEDGKNVNPMVAKILEEYALTPLVPGSKPDQESIHQMFDDINNAANSNPPNQNDTKGSENE